MYENIVVTYIITFIQVSISISLVESKTDDTDEILLPGYISKMKNRKTFACRKSDGIVLGYREKF
jgi:hypothetical protein